MERGRCAARNGIIWVKQMKQLVTVLFMACATALASARVEVSALPFGDSISNLSQIVGRDITQEVCLSMPAGHDFANWEATTLAVLRSMRTGDVTNFVANSTAGMLDREFEVSLTNGIPAAFSLAFSQTSIEYSRYRVTAYDITTNTTDSVCVNISVMLGRAASTNDIQEIFNFSLLKTNDVWKVDGL